MAKRKIVQIDEELCNGCGECVPSCAEGAIQIVDGKAKLVADNLCDGIGNCLGECPEGAIKIIEREAEAFDESLPSHAAPKGAPKPAHKPALHHPPSIALHAHAGGGCPGSRMLDLRTTDEGPAASAKDAASVPVRSELRQWPVQLHLVNPMAPYFQGADVALTADCVAYALPDFHQRFLKGKALAIACPKLDAEQEIYLEKITSLIDEARINTLTVFVMEVPCCSGLTRLAVEGAGRAQRRVPVKQVTIGLSGDVLDESWI